VVPCSELEKIWAGKFKNTPFFFFKKAPLVLLAAKKKNNVLRADYMYVNLFFCLLTLDLDNRRQPCPF